MVKNQTVTIQEPRFLKAADVAEILGTSKSTAYKIVQKMNDELKEQGKITVAGKVSARFFNEKVAL